MIFVCSIFSFLVESAHTDDIRAMNMWRLINWRLVRFRQRRWCKMVWTKSTWDRNYCGKRHKNENEHCEYRESRMSERMGNICLRTINKMKLLSVKLCAFMWFLLVSTSFRWDHSHEFSIIFTHIHIVFI